MLKRIFSRNNLPLKNKLKNLIAYYLRRRGATIQWSTRYKKVFMLYPVLKSPTDLRVEQAHRLYWKDFDSNLNLLTLRVCTNISGISNPKYIPEEVFRTDIEPSLNRKSSVEYLTCKSFYNYWFPGNYFPRDYFHNIEGEWLARNLEPITFKDVRSIAEGLDYPVVLKPNIDSYGGRNIYFPKDIDELMILVARKKNFIVQEKIKQHSFFEQFNHHGINTLRVNVYRSVKDNKFHIVNIVLRMGVAGSLDNETAGGIVSLIKKDGFLNGFAVDKYGKKYLSHPDTGVNFDQVIPDFKGLKNTALEIAHKIFFTRLICLDLCYDSENLWKMIEVNINGSTIRFAQYHGTLFFDEFTDEVRNYCLSNHWAFEK